MADFSGLPGTIALSFREPSGVSRRRPFSCTSGPWQATHLLRIGRTSRAKSGASDAEVVLRAHISPMAIENAN
jgi:hypothetical protein